MALEYQICIETSDLDINKLTEETDISNSGIVSFAETKYPEFSEFQQCINVRIDKLKLNEQGMLLGVYNVYRITSELCEKLNCNISLFSNYDVKTIRKTSEGIIFPSEREWIMNNLVKPYAFFKKT